MSNANIDLYGPVADAAASKYGLDTGLFRRLIMSESSFNPNAINPESVKGENAIGIAQFLPSTAKSRGVDPLNPYSAIDGAASYLSELIKTTGSVAGGVARYKGARDINNPLVTKVVGVSIYPDGVDPLGNQMGPDYLQLKNNANVSNTKSIWQYTSDDLKNAIQNGAWGAFFGFMGVLIVIFSVYMLTKQGGTNSLSAVKKVAGA